MVGIDRVRCSRADGSPELFVDNGRAQEEPSAVQPEAEGKSKGDLELNSDIQERAPKFGARSFYLFIRFSGNHLNIRKTRFRMMVSTMLIIMQVTMGKKN